MRLGSRAPRQLFFLLLEGLVQLKRDRRRMPQCQPLRQLAAQEALRRRQPREARLLQRVIARHADQDTNATQVLRQFNGGDCRQSDARIFHLIFD